jgi:ElaA protein
VLGRLDGVPVATGRLLVHDERPGFAHAGRIAVLAEHRGRGYGQEIMAALHDLAREHGFSGVTLGAQVHAIGFYEHIGYVARGPIFVEAGIDHRMMDISLTG